MVNIPIWACDENGEQIRSFHDREGREIPNPDPMEIPIGAQRPPTLDQMIKDMIYGALSAQAAESGAETFEEAGDFDIEDDPVDPLTPWEALFDPAVIERGKADAEAASPKPVSRADASAPDGNLPPRPLAVSPEEVHKAPEQSGQGSGKT